MPAEPIAALNLETDFMGLILANPVVLASGTCGFGRDLAPYLDLKRLGAVTVKSLTLEPRAGNPPPRLAETPAGLLNAIGLENPGVQYFLEEVWPGLKALGIPVIASVAGRTVDEYREVAERLEAAEGLAALEVNVSCPNVKEGGLAFGVLPETAAAAAAAVRGAVKLPLLVKLAPRVSNIVTIARAVVDVGADGLTLINTLPGMAIDIERRRPVLGNLVGGLSGPAVKPVALRAVWEVFEAFPEVPILGMGGITSGTDAIEFVLAGARAVGVGTATLIDPQAGAAVVDGIGEYCTRHGVTCLADLVGAAH